MIVPEPAVPEHFLSRGRDVAGGDEYRQAIAAVESASSEHLAVPSIQFSLDDAGGPGNSDASPEDLEV